jgi:hypothetical protein
MLAACVRIHITQEILLPDSNNEIMAMHVSSVFHSLLIRSSMYETFNNALLKQGRKKP